MGKSVERVPLEIPGVEVVGTFPIKLFLDTMYNFRTKKESVTVSATVTQRVEERRRA